MVEQSSQPFFVGNRRIGFGFRNGQSAAECENRRLFQGFLQVFRLMANRGSDNSVASQALIQSQFVLLQQKKMM